MGLNIFNGPSSIMAVPLGVVNRHRQLTIRQKASLLGTEQGRKTTDKLASLRDRLHLRQDTAKSIHECERSGGQKRSDPPWCPEMAVQVRGTCSIETIKKRTTGVRRPRAQTARSRIDSSRLLSFDATTTRQSEWQHEEAKFSEQINGDTICARQSTI